MATIKVRGRASVDVRADEALLTFEAVGVADGAADAFAAASERATALDDVLDDAGIEPERRSTVGIVLHEHQQFDEIGQPRRLHRASATIDVRMTQADAIPQLLGDVDPRLVSALRRQLVGRRAGARGVGWKVGRGDRERIGALGAVEASIA